MNWILRPQLAPRQTLPGNWLLLARALSGFVILASLGLFLIALPERAAWLERLAAEARVMFLGAKMQFPGAIDRYLSIFPALALVVECGVMLLYCLNAALIYSRRADDWLALITAAGLASFALHITPTLHTWMGDDPTNILIGTLAKGVGLGLAFLFLYLFPGGYYSPGWMRLFFLVWIAWVALWLVNPDSVFSFRDPYTIDVKGFTLLMLWWGIGIFSQIYRFVYVSGPVERQQTKYVTFGATIVVIGYSAYVPLREAMARLPDPALAQMVFQMIAPYVFLIMVGAIPLTITFSILRYRLWDIDLLIRRTLIYSTLSATLVVIYVLLVISLQAVVSGWMQGLPNYALAGTTLAVVAMINPLRRRIQVGIDRRFYRRKYDAEKLVMSFGASLRDEVEIDRLAFRLLDAAEETLQPARVELWLLAEQRDKTMMRVMRPAELTTEFQRRLG